MSKFKKQFKELGGWFITRHAINDYKERVTDDPLLRRHHTAIDIERRIRSAINHASESADMDNGAVAYRSRFTEGGSFYYIMTKCGHQPRTAVAVWTEEIYFNYLEGVTSGGRSIYERNL